ncbi:hypothetical protein ASE68_05440 [Agromyces sp. Leaf222]|nr:hypothetical protein ASE68_05440 [Agromyces sp. Leaf222]
MLVQLVSVITLSRLLTPEDFGLVAMVVVFMTLADLIRDFGLSGAALQAKQLSQQQASNLFWASWGLGAISAVVLVAATPLIVRLYDEPRLAQIIPAMALTLFISGAQAQLQVQLARRLKFTLLAASAFASSVVGLGVAVVAALNGWGYWALVIQPVVAAFTLLLIQSIGAHWLPSLPRRGHGSAHLFRSGAQLGAAYLLTWSASNVDSLLIGARWGATSLGYYNRAFQLTATLVGGLLGPLTKVAVPLLNEYSLAGKRPADALLRMQFLLAGPVCVLMVMLALTAPSLIPLVLGPQWAPAVPLVQILALGECIHVLSVISFWGFLAEGLSKQLLYYNLVTKPIAVSLVVVAAPLGVHWVAWAYVSGLAVSWPINLAWLSRTSNYEGRRFLVGGLRVLATAGTTYGLLWLALRGWAGSQSWWFVLTGAAGAVLLFVALTAAFPSGRRDLVRVSQVIKSLR